MLFSSIGLPELLIMAFVSCVVVWPFWKIFSKTGLPGFMSIVMLVPIVNFAMLFFLAFSDWPVLKELRELRAQRKTPI